MNEMTNRNESYAVRRKIWITPYKRSVVRGKGALCFLWNSVGVQHLSNVGCAPTEHCVAGGASFYPELRYACTGLSGFASYGGVSQIRWLKPTVNKVIKP
jgi:hypothetical protein